MANRHSRGPHTKNPASVAARGGVNIGLADRSKQVGTYPVGTQLATDRLRQLARDIRRVPDSLRSDPGRILELREEIAAEVHRLACRIDQGGRTVRVAA